MCTRFSLQRYTFFLKKTKLLSKKRKKNVFFYEKRQLFAKKAVTLHHDCENYGDRERDAG